MLTSGSVLKKYRKAEYVWQFVCFGNLQVIFYAISTFLNSSLPSRNDTFALLENPLECPHLDLSEVWNTNIQTLTFKFSSSASFVTAGQKEVKMFSSENLIGEMSQEGMGNIS